MNIIKENVEGVDYKIPHLLKYMGSKREILNFINASIKSLNVESEWLCDLFAGTGVVSGSLKGEYNIHANDVQAYSAILSSTYLSNLKCSIKPVELNIIKEKVLHFVQQFHLQYSNISFNYDNISNLEEFSKVELEQQDLKNREFEIGFHLFTKYYSGTYWSFEQCVWIDSIRAVSEQYIGKPEYFAILSSLIFSMSYTSPSTGHYAQFRYATSESSMQDIMLYRKREIWPYFERKFNELIISCNGNVKNYKVTTLDFIDCLRIIENYSIIYADPPYQSVHYSRFYHVLETLVRYDYPKLLYKGRYRDDRHQSPFCKKTTVNKAFTDLFDGAKTSKSHLVLSYSDTGMITLDQLVKLGNEVLGNSYSNEILTIDHFHSTMGRSDEKQQDVKEYALLFKLK